MFVNRSNMLSLAALSTVAPVFALPSFSQLVRRTQAPIDLCGDYDYIILQDSPWIVYNMLYNAAKMVGTQCTYYDYIVTTSSGTQEVLWNSETNIEYVASTDNVPKGYSFVGLTQNLETTILEINSIPATYEWTRTNTTSFKGDSTSNSSRELMLWLQYEGGQLPIGWDHGPSASIDSLFGTSWELYEDVNTDTGITVSSLLPTTQFDGAFSGDLKDWLLALVTLGKFTEETYVNVGNAGTEFFYGNAIMNATLALQIDIGLTTTTSTNAIAVSTNTAVVTLRNFEFFSAYLDGCGLWHLYNNQQASATFVAAPTSATFAASEITSVSSSTAVSFSISTSPLRKSSSASLPASKTHQRPSNTPSIITKAILPATSRAIASAETAAAKGTLEEDDAY